MASINSGRIHVGQMIFYHDRQCSQMAPNSICDIRDRHYGVG